MCVHPAKFTLNVMVFRGGALLSYEDGTLMKRISAHIKEASESSLALSAL